MDQSTLITLFVTLFVMIDPIGQTPIFMALTKGIAPQERRKIAIRACTIALAILTAFLLLGEQLLSSIGITVPAFRIAGGILLFMTALDMLFEKRTQRRENTAGTAALETNDPSVFPLAIPLMAGPGTLTALILLSSNVESPMDYVLIWLLLFALMIICFGLFAAASWIERMLGKTGVNVVTRILGLLLAALSVQFILDGLQPFLAGMVLHG